MPAKNFGSDTYRKTFVEKQEKNDGALELQKTMMMSQSHAAFRLSKDQKHFINDQYSQGKLQQVEFKQRINKTNWEINATDPKLQQQQHFAQKSQVLEQIANADRQKNKWVDLNHAMDMPNPQQLNFKLGYSMSSKAMQKLNTEKKVNSGGEFTAGGPIDSVTRWGTTKGNWQSQSDNVKGSRKQSHATRMAQSMKDFSKVGGQPLASSRNVLS